MTASLPCFKAYDLRGRQPEELNPALAFVLGQTLAQTQTAHGSPLRTAILGMDSRATSPLLLRAFAAGLAAAGVSCQSLGLCGTEEIYHAVGSGAADMGVMVTASHNPIEYNGFKLAKRGGVPLDLATEFAAWHAAAAQADPAQAPADFPEVPTVSLRDAYTSHLLSLIDPNQIPAQRIVINAGNGAAGPTADAILARLPQLEVVRLHHAPDGTFPHGIPNPLLPENRTSTAQAVRDHGASLGIAWDGDFDRCFLYDDQGSFISSYYLTTLLAEAILRREPGATLIHDPRLYWATLAAVTRLGGKAQICKVGHGYIKPAMRTAHAPFAGEVSGHYYFRDFFTCDSGMLPWLLVLQLLGQRGQSLAAAVAALRAAYPAGEEQNFRTPTPAKAFLAQLEPELLRLAPAHERIDGLSLTDAPSGWRANLRASSNEPLLRLNVEATSAATLNDQEARLVELITRHGATPASGH